MSRPHLYARRLLGALVVLTTLVPVLAACGKSGPISKSEVNTGIQVHAGDTVHITSTGAPKLNADGDDESAPAGYPAPALRKNSLICRVGSIWYQGGADRTFVVSQPGTLVIRPDDANLADNSRGWQVSGTIRTP